MAKFLTTSGMTHGIEDIIVNAQSRIIIVSPYIKITRNYYERLLEAIDNKVKVTFVYGKQEMGSDQQAMLFDMKNLDLRHCENLHAKCYLNETSALIGSMNLYEYSQNNNREMGIAVNKQGDFQLYADIVREVESIIKASVSTGKEQEDSKVEENESHGICIRCKKPIPFDTSRPYCFDCYQAWSQYQNISYVDKYCHYCGKLTEATIVKPLCRSCNEEMM